MTCLLLRILNKVGYFIVYINHLLKIFFNCFTQRITHKKEILLIYQNDMNDVNYVLESESPGKNVVRTICKTINLLNISESSLPLFTLISVTGTDILKVFYKIIDDDTCVLSIDLVDFNKKNFGVKKIDVISRNRWVPALKASTCINSSNQNAMQITECVSHEMTFLSKLIKNFKRSRTKIWQTDEVDLLGDKIIDIKINLTGLKTAFKLYKELYLKVKQKNNKHVGSDMKTEELQFDQKNLEVQNVSPDVIVAEEPIIPTDETNNSVESTHLLEAVRLPEPQIKSSGDSERRKSAVDESRRDVRDKKQMEGWPCEKIKILKKEDDESKQLFETLYSVRAKPTHNANEKIIYGKRNGAENEKFKVNMCWKENTNGSSKPVKKKEEVILVADSHGRNCSSTLNELIGSSAKVFGLVLPGAPLQEVIRAADEVIRNGFTKNGIILIMGGTNDISERTSYFQCIKLYTKLKPFLKMHANYFNIGIVAIPNRYDRPWLNDKILFFNKKCNTKLKEEFPSVKFVSMFTHRRKDFTNHGLHMNDRGKEKFCVHVASMITKMSEEGNKNFMKFQQCKRAEECRRVIPILPPFQERYSGVFATELTVLSESRRVYRGSTIFIMLHQRILVETKNNRFQQFRTYNNRRNDNNSSGPSDNINSNDSNNNNSTDHKPRSYNKNKKKKKSKHKTKQQETNPNK